MTKSSTDGSGGSGQALTDKMLADASACVAAAIAAVEPEGLVRRHVLGLGERTADWSAPTHIVAIGKGAPAMAKGAVRALQEMGCELPTGLILVPRGYPDEVVEGLTTVLGEHPVPGKGSVEGATAVRDLLIRLTSQARLLCLISGGGSALLTLPAEGLSLPDISITTGLLLEAGATIEELNTVRKHLDQLKGGQMALLAAGVVTTTLILSDVVGDPLDVIASGPLSPDPTTFGDALGILEAKGIMHRTPVAVVRRLESGQSGDIDETPGLGADCFQLVDQTVIGNGPVAAAAAGVEARSRGYNTFVLSTEQIGEAREVGKMLAGIAQDVLHQGQPVSAPACVITAGETTVTVTGKGRGGRNHELALGAAVALAGQVGVVVASAGTDGIDGSSSAAGATVHLGTIGAAKRLGLDPQAALKDNDTHTFFEALGDGIVTGPTGTNVGDIQVVLIRSE